ncbi:MAG: high-potential iron-sulfur protein [Haloferacaceae archaeon]
MADRNGNPRRQFLRLTSAATIVGLAGCSGNGGGGNSGATSGGGGGNGRGLGPVPEEYATATAQGGMQRDPDSLQTKRALNYQSSPNNGQQCSGCKYYIPDKNGDGLGACTLVEGKIEPTGWCVSYVAQG